MRWAEKAACAGYGMDAFFPEDSGNVPSAVRRVCGGCPVQAECLEWAIQHEDFGYWGGTSVDERRRMRRRRGIRLDDSHVRRLLDVQRRG